MKACEKIKITGRLHSRLGKNVPWLESVTEPRPSGSRCLILRCKVILTTVRVLISSLLFLTASSVWPATLMPRAQWVFVPGAEDLVQAGLWSCVSGVSKKLPNAGVNGYFNPAAFTVPVTVVGSQGQNVQTFGNCGHFPTTGPGYKNLDSSIFKDLHYSQSSYAEIRAEFFDTTNTPSFTLPAANDATLTCQGAPGAPCNASNANFGKLSNGSATGRQVQFSLKLYF